MQDSPEQRPLVISIRVMNAATYVQLRKGATMQQDYIESRKGISHPYSTGTSYGYNSKYSSAGKNNEDSTDIFGYSGRA